MLSSTFLREALLACLPHLLGICLPSLWSLLSAPHALTLIPISLIKLQLLLVLTLSLLMIWYSELMALFLFLLARAAPVYLPTALFVAPRPIFPFQQAQYVQLFLLKPAPFCMLFAGLDSTNKSATSLFLLSDSCSVLATLFSPPSFLLPQFL